MGRTTIHPLTPGHRAALSVPARALIVLALGAGALAIAVALVGRAA